MSHRWILPVSVAVLTVICFLPALTGSFLNWDDNVNFLENTAYRGLGPAQVRWAFASVLFSAIHPPDSPHVEPQLRPGRLLDPSGYHLVNLLLHAGNALLVYIVARRLLAAAEDDGRRRRDPSGT